MYFVLTIRAIKVATGTTERYGARTSTRTGPYIAGPFTEIGTAEQAALAAMAVHTCLNAQVVTLEQLRAIRRASNSYELDKMIDRTISLFGSTGVTYER